MKHAILTVTGLLLPALAVLQAETVAPKRPVKKLVEYGWDLPYPDQVRKNIRSMEKRPFDGIIFRLRDWNHAFDPRPWDEAKLRPQLDDLAAIEWQTFTDNVWCYSERMSWWAGKVPDGAEAAIRSARQKIADGQPLGFDIADLIAAGQKRMSEAAKARTATPGAAKK